MNDPFDVLSKYVECKREGNEIVMLNRNRPDRRFGSFKYNLRTGLWKDFAIGHQGQGLDSLLAYLRIPREEWPSIALERRHTTALRQDNTRFAERIWENAKPAKGTPVEEYLRARGILMSPPLALRYESSLRYDAERSMPGMVAAVRSSGGELVAVHRTYLRGSSKAEVSPVRKLLGSPRGGAVHLGEPRDLVAITEGIETGLSLQMATAIPTWAALSAAGMTSIILPEYIRDVLIGADGDDAGESAAQLLQRRLVGEGRRVRIARPPRDKDFNDLLKEPG